MKIKAAVLHEIGLDRPYATSRPVHVEDVDLAPPGRGEVLVEIAVAGVCHSDLSVINGNRPRAMPMVLGHEGSGTVMETGAGVDDLRPHDPVVFVFMPSCGACAMCLQGRPALCAPGAAANAAGTLLGGAIRLARGGQPYHHQVGVSCFASHAVVHRSSLVKIDKNLPLDQAALFSCAVITGVGAVMNTAALPKGASAAVVGLGGTGLAALLGARAAEAGLLVGIDPIVSKRELAEKLGADRTFDSRATEAAAMVRDATDGGLDYVFECAGSVKAMEFAYAITRRGGTTVSSGLSHPKHDMKIQHVSLVAEERTIKGSYLGSCIVQDDMPRYIELFKAGRLPIDALVSRHIGLDDLNGAFDALADGTEIRQMITID